MQWKIVLFLMVYGQLISGGSMTQPATNMMNSSKNEMTTMPSAMMTTDQTDTTMIMDNGNMMNELMMKCNQSYPIQMDYLKELNSTGSFPDETDKIPMCYIKCFLEGVGILSGNSMWNRQILMDMMPDADDDIINRCTEEQDGLFDISAPNGQCEMAYYMLRCLMTKTLMASRNGEEFK